MKLRRSFFILAAAIALAAPWQGVTAEAPALEAVTPPRAVLRDAGFDAPAVTGTGVDSPHIAPATLARSTIIVEYSGFSAEAKTAFEKAVEIWQGYIASPVPIRVFAAMEPLDTGVLGSAGPSQNFRNFDGAPAPNVFYASALANRLAGRDLNPAGPDIEAAFNSDYGNWYFGLDGHPPPGLTDFVTVVLHELCHGLGFTDSMRYSRGSGNGGFGQGLSPAGPKIFDVFVANGAGDRLVSSFASGSRPFGEQLVSKGLWFSGPRAMAAAGGQRPRLYSPETFEDGSSISHLDEETYPAGSPNALMTPELARSEAIHDPGPIALGILADMGWALAGGPPLPLAPRRFIGVIALLVRDAGLP
jgi:hypothetical protein